MPPETNPTRYFEQYAQDLGLDLAQFKRQSKSSIIRDGIMASYNDARSKDLTGTPSFYLNGQKMNLTSYQDFKDQIAAAVHPSVDFGTATATSSTTAVVQ